MMTYKEAVAYLYGIPKFTKKHSLEHTVEFLDRLGNPQNDQKVIHVAGTNGKGSVCAYMQAMLMAEGKNVGLFTSPHLVSVNERIRINGCPVDDELFLQVFQKVKDTVDGMVRDGISHPSYFEFLFGMGMMVFSEKALDYVILETGLGGRLDATNAVKNPVLTVITSISLDHTQYLGDTVEAIAWEKAGILKEGVPLIYDGSSKEAAAVIRREAERRGVRCREITNHAFEIREIVNNHIAFSRVNAYDKGVMWQLHNCGIYQVMNAGIGLAGMEELMSEKERHYEKWQQALASVVWEGRMEQVCPNLWVDGAHNLGAIQGFADTLERMRHKKMPVILFAVVADKDYLQMIEKLCHKVQAKEFIITELKEERRVSAEILAEEFRKHTTCPVQEIADIEAACKQAAQMAADGERVYCLGSLYLVGAVKAWLMGGKDHA